MECPMSFLSMARLYKAVFSMTERLHFYVMGQVTVTSDGNGLPPTCYQGHSALTIVLFLPSLSQN